MGNRGILTQLLTVSCQIHIYISLQQTYRIKTKSSPVKSMYNEEDLSVNNTQHFFFQKSTWASFSTPIQLEKDKEELRPLL